MDQIINWEPQSVADLAEALSRIANEYRLSIINIYNCYAKISERGLWTGKNYNSIASEIFNHSKSTFEEWSDFLQYTIPEIVYTIAKEQASIAGGTLSFALYKSYDDIKNIELTYESTDGSFALNLSEVKNIIDNEFSIECDMAIKKLDDYSKQFEELGTLNENMAIITIYTQLENILNKNKSILRTFQEQIATTIEMSIRKTEITNEETIQIADKITSILNI